MKDPSLFEILLFKTSIINLEIWSYKSNKRYLSFTVDITSKIYAMLF